MMPTTIGNDFEYFDIASGGNTVRHLIKDSEAREDISDLQNAIGTVPSGETVEGQIAENVQDISDLKSAFDGIRHSDIAFSDLINNPASVEPMIHWMPGGIDSSGIETDNNAFRRTDYIEIPQGQKIICTVAQGYAVVRSVYNLDKSFRSQTTMTTSFEVNVASTLLFRFTVNALSDYNLPDKISDVVTIALTNKIKTDIDAVSEIATDTKARFDAAIATAVDIDLWEIGGLAGGNGAETVASARIRTPADITDFAVSVNPNPGYKYLIYCYNSTGVFVGVYDTTRTIAIGNNSWFTSACDLLALRAAYPAYQFRICGGGIENISFNTMDNLQDKIIITADTHKYTEYLIRRYRNTYEFVDGAVTPETIENTTITDLSELSGKTCYLVGDSMTADGALGTYLNSRMGLLCSNFGFSGSTIAQNNTTLNAKSMVERVTGTASSDNIEGSGDIWVVWGGYNDASYRGTPIGTPDSTDIKTIYGALKTICETIQRKTNNPRLLLVTVHQANARLLYTGSNDGKGGYIQKMREAFFTVGEMYGVPVLDLYKCGGISRLNCNQLTSDGLHLNDKGKQFIYPKIANAIKQMV